MSRHVPTSRAKSSPPATLPRAAPGLPIHSVPAPRRRHHHHLPPPHPPCLPYAPARFLRTPADQVGVSGGVASFVCQATGDPQPNITWAKKGKRLTSQRFEVIEFDGGAGSVLRVQPLRTVRDEGSYECIAYNNLGQIPAAAKLTVLREEQVPAGFPRIDMAPQLKVVERTRTVTMLCAASGNPEPTVTWYKDYLPLDVAASDGRIRLLPAGGLQIEKSRDLDQGKYECVASNSLGTVYSTPANLYVRELRPVRHVPPRLTTPPVSQEVMPGASVNVTCVATGSPLPYVKWMSGGEDLTPEEEMPIARNVLELSNVRESANYTCVALSSLGVVEATAQISVKALPRPPGAPVVTETTPTSVTLTWDSGNTERVSHYTLLYRPRHAGHGGGATTTGTRARPAPAAPSEPTPPFQEIDTVTTTRYTVGGLGPYSQYEFRVAAVNTVGRGPPGGVTVTRTGEQAPSSAPRNVQAHMISSTAMLVTWEEPEEPNGHILGYRVFYHSNDGDGGGGGGDDEDDGDDEGHESGKNGAFTQQQELHREPVHTWKRSDTSDVMLATIRDLTPQVDYAVRVLAYTSVGDGPFSPELRIRTQEGVPNQPINLKAEAESASSVLLAWTPPRQEGILKYELAYRPGDGTATTATASEQVVTFDPTMTYLLEGLKPNTLYSFRLAARSGHGLGPATLAVTARTMPSTAFVKNFRVKSVTQTSVLLVWEAPASYSSSEPLKVVSSDGQAIEVDGWSGRKRVSGLRPDTEYRLGLTSRGDSAGALQQEVGVRTAPQLFRGARPVPLGRVSADGTISLDLPQPADGVQLRSYCLVVVPLARQKGRYLRPSGSPEELDLDQLMEETTPGGRRRRRRRRRATPRGAAADAAGGGAAAYVTARWDGGPPPPPSAGAGGFVVGDGARLGGHANRPLQEGRAFTFFAMAAIGSRDARMWAVSGYSEPVVSPEPEPLPISEEEEGLLWVVGPVLAVIFIICVVIAILLYKSKPDRKRSDSDPTKPILLGDARPAGRGSSGGGGAGAGPGGTAAPAGSGGGGGGAGAAEAFGKENAAAAQQPTDPVELRRINFQTPGMMSHPPIAVEELVDHVERLKANDNMLFAQEYESIDPGQQFTWEHSNLEVNKPKNRYANVIAYDHSRVLLAPVDGEPGSDYINANYMDGYRKHNAYIATQGPLPETFADFWRMVWEQRSATVVMMTKLEERSRVKCDRYWPARGSETYGTLTVALQDTMDLATYCVRTFTLQRGGSGERREVRQFQFTAWPDHGVPEYPTPFLAFLRRVKACNPPDAGPMVVHCSAGVGRTGCFVALDAALERLRSERTADAYGLVTCLRSQRNYTVQTEEQYAFVHEALLEAASAGGTEVPARSLHAHVRRLASPAAPHRHDKQQAPPPPPAASSASSAQHKQQQQQQQQQPTTGGGGGASSAKQQPQTVTAAPSSPQATHGITGMVLEFKRLANTRLSPACFVSANLPCNKFKNRLVNVLPYEVTRVPLQPIRGVEGSDYINASFIDGYRQQAAYIATQGPMAETTEDLWRMLWEHNSTIVVMLTKLREMGREKCHQYWPAERSARYQYFVVDPMAEYNMPQYILREFKVTDARDGQSRTVRQFQFTDWPEQGVPKTGEGFIDFIGQVHKTKEQFGQDGPITVHCSAGVGRTGVFIALSMVLERMRYEGVVDMFQTVKILRTQRAGMVQTEEQYHFCYRAALEYLASFDHYST
ncbi:receptor-type tyrosine-protein phosphatase S-like isoform X2 [Petromyzon marinus]|uniref:receptor-type tyrosine-protein phosphatase S-like isoform X2 n=1 Tax=Petromyzon marinus TaxID=7757 RepID=UPI003F720F82